MDPILRVIHYLFEKNCKSNIEETIQSFFENGLNFGQFVALAFNIKKIPQFNSDPQTPFHKKLNNELAYKYLLQNDPEIEKNVTGYDKQQDQSILLSLILKTKFFTMEFHDALSKCNQIMKPFVIKFENNDIINEKLLLTLLNTLTDGKISLETETKDIDKILINSFEKANVPLVISKNSLETKDSFLFCIQIQIIFDVFSDKINQLLNSTPDSRLKDKMAHETDFINSANLPISKKDDLFDNPEKKEDCHIKSNKSYFPSIKDKKKKKKSIIYEESPINQQEKIMDQAILDTINAIGKKCQFHVNNFEEAIQDDKITRFVYEIFKDDQISQEIIKNIVNSPNKNKINAVLNYLKTKDPEFKFLLFDFEDPNYVLSSSISLYTHILDFFFLKKSKEELYDRCYTLVCGRYTKKDHKYRPYSDFYEILCDWNTYDYLINFISKNKNMNVNVPVVISKSYLKKSLPKDVPNAAFYQLQFIFDALDSHKSFWILECFFITIRKFAQIKMPQTEELIKRIRAKNISFILQNKRYKKNITKKSINAQTNQNSLTQTFSMPKFSGSYLNRKVENTSNEEITFTKKPLDIKKKFHQFDNGILYTKGVMDYDEWISFHVYTENDKKKKKKVQSGYVPLFLKKTESFDQSSICKLFYFDEKSNRWIYNKNEFDSFANSTRIFNDNFKVPLISFADSNLDHSFEILKNIFFGGKNINLKSDEICVFGFYGRKLEDMKYDKKIVNHSVSYEVDNVKPLFLHLYIPDNKKELPNIKTIIFQIYFFIYVICDFVIVLLDYNKAFDQAKFRRKISSLKYAYVPYTFHKLSKENENENDIIIKQINHKYKNNELLAKIEYDFFNNDTRYIFGFDTENDWYIRIKKKKSNSSKLGILLGSDYITFLNSKNPSTYGDFIEDFIDLASYIRPDKNKMIFKFNLIQLFKMEDFYVDLISLSSYSDELEIYIFNRFSELIGNDKPENYSSYFSILQEEILNSFPVFDSKFMKECNIIFNKLNNMITKNKINVDFEKELQLSSNNHIQYLLELIKHKNYWTEEQLNNLKLSHVDFLKDEFFAMIRDFCSKKDSNIVYFSKKSILENQISNDIKRLTEIFEEIEEKQKKVQIKVDAQKGTNYTIREKENEREVKARIDKEGKLEDLIPQDF